MNPSNNTFSPFMSNIQMESFDCHECHKRCVYITSTLICLLFRRAMLAQHLPDFCQYMSHFLLVIANYLFEFFITLFKDCKYDNLLTVMVIKKLFTKKFSIMAFPLIIGDDLWRILQHCSVCFDWLSMRLKNILSF